MLSGIVDKAVELCQADGGFVTLPSANSSSTLPEMEVRVIKGDRLGQMSTRYGAPDPLALESRQLRRPVAMADRVAVLNDRADGRTGSPVIAERAGLRSTMVKFTAWDRQRGLHAFTARRRLGSDLIVDQAHATGLPMQLVGPVDEWRAQNPFVAERTLESGITNGATSFVPMSGKLGKWGFLIAQRDVPVAFDEDEIALLQEFAAQAVIALDNAELFTALENRNRALAESFELQTATNEVLTLISANPGDLRVVLDGIAARAGALCGATEGGVLLVRGDVLRFESATNCGCGRVAVAAPT